MDAQRRELNDLQRAVLGPIVKLIRQHTRDHPIKSERICDEINSQMPEIWPDFPQRKITGRDIQLVAAYCRLKPWPQTIPICSHGGGYYYATDPEDLAPFLKITLSRIRELAKVHRNMFRYRRHLRMETNHVQADIFEEKADPMVTGPASLQHATSLHCTSRRDAIPPAAEKLDNPND